MMDQPPEQIRSELENFREQWRAEVSARTRNPTSSQQQQGKIPFSQAGTSSSSSSNHPPRRTEPSHKRAASKVVGQWEEEGEYIQTRSFDESGPSQQSQGGQRLDGQDVTLSQDKEQAAEPKTALDFYEHAVERENTGKLGDSLQLYRRAFRMDNHVDKAYRQKHFPGRWKPTQPNPSNAPVTVPNTAHHSLEGPPLSLPDLIVSFAGMTLQGAPSEIEGTPAPPCPISALPDEILLHILRDVAVADIGDFVRLSQVCKRLAYLVATEDRIWRRVCLGSEFGFGGMHYHWNATTLWEPLDHLVGELSSSFSSFPDEHSLPDHLRRNRAADKPDESATLTTALHLSGAYGGSWQSMFRRRPRVRFNGCYISTVNYIRAGQASGNTTTSWNYSPVHIVTYYRYLRLFRDGTAISLLTTDEPAHVVHHLTRDNVALHAGGNAPHLPSSVMAQALRGRWRLRSSLEDPDDRDPDPEGSGPGSGSAPPDHHHLSSNNNNNNTTTSTIPNSTSPPKPPPEALADLEGDLIIETEGSVGNKYIFRMDLSLLRTPAAGARKNTLAPGSSSAAAAVVARHNNNKLVWKGFWSYNRLADDWAEFSLKNGKPFFFSRVRSYGFGG
ncbi:hypothetical protein F4778DRAFT_750670 [Xylariomycetidae sp. FL2044]|nr:hypothetical protein F4778DRAFT_750670 [Xylariomycetidae sp. FL2044]